MIVSLIVAMSENRAIGRGGKLPWHLPEDLRHFRRLTEGHAVVMGRRTYESIGRLLPKRDNIILTRRADYAVDGAQVHGSLDEALADLSDRDEIFIIGGGELYRQALGHADRIYLTLIHRHVEGDTYFPELPPGVFVEQGRQSFEEPMPFSFITLMRQV